MDLVYRIFYTQPHMPIFNYKAFDQSSSAISGVIDASNEETAYRKLSERNLEVFSLKEQAEQFQFNFSTKVRDRDLARYITQLATLLGAGVGLLEALDSLSKSKVHSTLAKASGKIRSDLRAGENLSETIVKHLPNLPSYLPRLVELGEVTGQSAKALKDAAERMEFDYNNKNEIKTALSYPIFLAVIGTLIVLLLFVFIVPRFESLIGPNQDNLPLISKIVINTGTALTNNLPVFVLVLVTIVGGVTALRKNINIQRFFATFLEKLWIIGPALVQADLGGWARTVGIALDNGADLLSALRLGHGGVKSNRIRAGLKTTYNEIRAGRNIDEVLLENIPDFDPLTIDLVRTGRTSGKLAEMLLFVGEMQEKETRKQLKRITALAEPIAILIVSMVIGTIVIGIVLAMTSLYNFDVL